MINLTDNAKKHLDNYLQQVQTCLKDCPTVDADEVEQNIKEHIESELQGLIEPASFDALDDILKKLGSPQQWLPEEISWWRKIILRLRTGPEDWRLAYLSFGLVILAALLFIDNKEEISFILTAASFVVSRATLSVAGGNNELSGQKWLLYPSLVIVYLFIFFWLLVWPVLPLFALAEELEHLDADVFPWNIGGETAYWALAFVAIAAATCLWWLILSLILKAGPHLLRAIFKPFAQNITPKLANWFMGIAAALFVVCLTFLLLMIACRGEVAHFTKNFK
ncbi:MAG: hypothetical protein ACYS8Y_06185 [Planctomycetota bacterium]|jgi:hypothetical protein